MAPSATYIYDSMTTLAATNLFLNITMYNKMNQGLKASRFTQIKELGRIFIPTATYNQSLSDQKSEYVSIVEGNAFPFFGLAFSPDKVLFNYDYTLEDTIDYSRNSILHAQYLANYFVDEARYSSQEYSKTSVEDSSLISNYDPLIVSKDIEDGTTATTFVYLFK